MSSKFGEENRAPQYTLHGCVVDTTDAREIHTTGFQGQVVLQFGRGEDCLCGPRWLLEPI